MMATWRILWIVEGPQDRRRGAILLDHRISARVSWAEDLDAFREHGGLGTTFDSADGYLPYKKLKRLAESYQLPMYGDDSGVPGGGEAKNIRRIRWVLRILRPGPNVVVIVLRDSDGDLAREEALRAGLSNTLAAGLPRVIIGAPHACSEAWVICGINEGAVDEDTLQGLQARLGFHPLRAPHWLVHEDHVPRSAKEALQSLLPDGDFAETAALQRAMERRPVPAADTRLSAFIDDVDAWLTAAGADIQPT